MTLIVDTSWNGINWNYGSVQNPDSEYYSYSRARDTHQWVDEPYRKSVAVSFNHFEQSIQSIDISIGALANQVQMNANALETVRVWAENSTAQVLGERLEQFSEESEEVIQILREQVELSKALTSNTEAELSLHIEKQRKENAELKNAFTELCRALTMDDLEEAKRQARQHLAIAWIEREEKDHERIHQSTA